MEEIWKDIEGYDGLYQVSDMGRVKSLDRYTDYGMSKGIVAFRKGVIMKPFINNAGNGYECVKLSKFGVKTIFSVHRLVAIAFLPNPDNKTEVNHIDGNTRNNKVYNLEWCTHSENMKHAFKTGLCTPNHNFRHSENAKRAISRKNMWGNSIKNRIVSQFTLSGEFIRDWNGFCEIKRELGYCESSIVNCCKGRYKQSYGYIWKYSDRKVVK